MVDVCCGGAIETSLVITNNLPVPKTINVFGGSISMESVEDNVSSFSIADPAFPLPQSGGPYVFDEATGYMYVGGVDSLSIVDTLNNNAIVNTIITGVGDNPNHITLVSSIRRVYITCSGVGTFTNNLIVINADTGTEIGRYTVGYTPNQSVYCPTNGCLYIACRFGAQLSIFNTTTNAVTNISLSAGEPVCLCYDPVHEYIYISNSDPNPGSGIVDVFSILGNVLLAPISVGDEPVQVIYQDGFVYIATESDASVSRINTSTNTNSLITGFTGPRYLFYSSITNRVYVCGFVDAFLGVINPDTGLAETPIDTGGLVANYILYNTVNDCFYVYTPAEILIFNNDFSELITTLSLPAISGGTFSANGSLYQPSTTVAFNVVVISITPGVSIEGSGGVTLSQLNSDFTSNPICICKLNISSTDQSAFNVPLSKNETLSTGSILNTKISLLAKYNANDVQSVIVLDKEDFKTCVLDGDNYLNWQIPANCIITLVLSYCQARREDLIGKELDDKPRARKKRYIHGAFKFAIN